MSLVLRRTGYKNGLALGLVVMAVGALVFLPAAMLRIYGVFLAGLFVLGTGLTILQTRPPTRTSCCSARRLPPPCVSASWVY